MMQGYALVQKGEGSAALAALRQSVAVDPHQADAWNNLVRAATEVEGVCV